jgi:hypothetical protein
MKIAGFWKLHDAFSEIVTKVTERPGASVFRIVNEPEGISQLNFLPSRLRRVISTRIWKTNWEKCY